MPRLPKGQRPERMQVQVPKRAYAAVERLEASTGQDRKEVVGKTLEWLAAQDERVQKLIIYAMPETLRPDFARFVLDLMISESAGAGGGAGENSKAVLGRSSRRTNAAKKRGQTRKRSGTDD